MESRCRSGAAARGESSARGWEPAAGQSGPSQGRAGSGLGPGPELRGGCARGTGGEPGRAGRRRKRRSQEPSVELGCCPPGRLLTLLGPCLVCGGTGQSRVPVGARRGPVSLAPSRWLLRDPLAAPKLASPGPLGSSFFFFFLFPFFSLFFF